MIGTGLVIAYRHLFQTDRYAAYVTRMHAFLILIIDHKIETRPSIEADIQLNIDVLEINNS